MAWLINFAAEDDVLLFANIIQFWAAARERMWALAHPYLPERINLDWDVGTVTGISDDGTNFILTDSGKTWSASPQRWYNYIDEDSPFIPQFYDVIIDSDNLDHSKHVRASIVGNTATTLILDRSIANYVAGKWITNAASLVGKKYRILKNDGLWWGDFWPKTPNDHQLWNGFRGQALTVTIVGYTGLTPDGSYVGKTFSDTTGTGIIHAQEGGKLIVAWMATAPTGAFEIKDGSTVIATGTVSGTVKDGLYRAAGDFPVGAFAGKHLVISATPEMARITGLASNTASLIEFAKRSTPFQGDSFCIMDTAGRAWPGPVADYPFRWYGGVTDDYWTRKVGFPPIARSTTPPQTVPMPATSITLSEFTGFACEDVIHSDIFDNPDVWSEVEETCGPADECYAPHFYKSIRSLQYWIEHYCIGFVPVDNYQGKRAIPTYAPATVFRDISAGYIGTYTVIADEDGNYTFTGIGSAGDGEYHYVVLNADGSVRHIGTNTGTSLFFDDNATDGAVLTLVAAKGWKRKYARCFAHAYARSAFIPDINNEGDDPVVVDPPTNLYPGSWTDLSPSTHYSEVDSLGFTDDIGPAFINGVRTRYRADNWGDPSVYFKRKADGDALDAAYYRNLWLGKFDGERFTQYEARKAGAITYGGRKWFRQDTHDWWSSPMGVGTAISHTGTATSGSSTTLTDTTRTWIPPGGSTPELIPFWNSTDNGPRFVGMMLEVTKTVNDVNGDPRTVTYHTPITGHSNTTVTFAAVPAFTIADTGTVPQINAPALTVAAGDAYAIREPYRRNWFAGRKITITKGATSETKKVTYHDGTHLWFDSNVSFDIDKDTTFVITELKPGYVYEWDATHGEWVEVTGTTHAGNELHPATVTAYGRLRKNDYVGDYIFKQLYDAFNKLVWTKAQVAWTAEDTRVEHVDGWTNVGQFLITDASDPPTSAGKWDTFLAAYESGTLTGTGEYLNQPPEYYTNGSLAPTASQLNAKVRFAYPSVDPPDYGGLTRKVEIFCYSQIDALDHDEGETADTVTIGGGPDTSVAYSRFAFDKHGLNLVFRRYSKIADLGFSADDKFYDFMIPIDPTAYIPPIDKPHEYGTQPNGGGGTEYFSGSAFMGFHITDSVAIVKWNVDGGFVYVNSVVPPIMSMAERESPSAASNIATSLIWADDNDSPY